MNDDLLRETLRELYEQAPCGYIFTLPDGTLVRVNQTFLTMTGYAREELVPSKRFQDLLTVPGKIFYENQYAPLLRMQGSVQEVAFDLVRKDGDRLPVLVNSVQRSDEDGRPLMVASTVFDATHRRRYEQELLAARRRVEQLAAIVTDAGDAIATASPDGVVESWNAGAERLFGYPARDAIGQSLHDVLAPADADAWTTIMGELRAGRTVHLDAVALRADGRRVDVSVGLTPHPGPLGELRDMALIIRDTSERRALERLRHEFLAMASHELRNPLASIKGHAQLMLRHGRYSERGAETIVTQTDHLDRLVNDLLLASQIAAGRLAPRLDSSVDLCAEAQQAAEALVRPDGPPVRVETPAEPVPVVADPIRLRQVLSNLLTNAAKYSPADAEITVRVTRDGRDGREAAVAVADRGAGIPAEALPRLFERFYRVQATAARARGLGLGLYITQQLVMAMGGRIEVESEVGQGSTFTVYLPVA